MSIVAEDQLNIARYLPELAQQQPRRPAVTVAQGRDRHGRVAYRHLTFAQLDATCDRYAWGLHELGVGSGKRVLLMVRPGLDFVAICFALFKLGAIPILIDPGMGVRGFLRCVEQSKPQVFIGIAAAQILRRLRPHAFRSVELPVLLGRLPFWRGAALDRMPPRQQSFALAPTQARDTAAILFTSGSTGAAKGVIYTHAIFDAQVQMIRRQYNISCADTDLECFPLFALFSVAMGMSVVIPEMDATRPAAVNPQRILEAVRDHNVTISFGSPALWRTVSSYCVEHKIRLPGVKRVLMAGAPVPGYLHRRMLHELLDADAEVHTPYGATECLPVSTFRGSEMLAETDAHSRAGGGTCVGRPLREMTVQIIGITDDVIAVWNDDLPLPPGQIGEIVVCGPVTTPAYDGLMEQTRLAKIQDHDSFWHRMGDVGYFDDQRRLWFCGRKNHRVVVSGAQTLFTIPCEAIVNEHPQVARSALVGIGADRYNQRPVMIVEPEAEAFPRRRRQRQLLREQILLLMQQSPLTAGIGDVLFHRRFPVDVRHNAKIRREQLAIWAARQLKSPMPTATRGATP